MDFEARPDPATARLVAVVSENIDIVERLKAEFDACAVCYCGNGLSSGQSVCDNHAPTWMPDDHTRLISDARHEIEKLRATLDGKRDIAELVMEANRTMRKDVPDTIAWQSLVRLARDWRT
jgi:hypothetical protein